MLVRCNAVFTMVPESKIAAVGCKGLEKGDGLGPRMKATVNSVYDGVNNRDNLFLSCCCF
jgi:hypothetical protein